MLNEIDYALIALIVVEYALVPISLFRKNTKIPDSLSLEEAFGMLESSIKRKYPGLPGGFSWKEAMARIKSSSRGYQKLDWNDIESTLKKYEAFRYGGLNYPETDIQSVLRLARILDK